jgi:hypothetical protein
MNRVNESLRIRRERDEAMRLTRSVVTTVTELGTRLGEPIRSDVLEARDGMQQALQAHDAAAVHGLFPELNGRASLLAEHVDYHAEVTRLRAVVGSASANGEIDAALAAASSALRGTSWDEVSSTRQVLVTLSAYKLNPARQYQQFVQHLEQLGAISPELTRQMQQELAPLQRALRAGSWEDMDDALMQRDELVGYPLRISNRILQGDEMIKLLQPEERVELESAVAASRAALRGDSWEAALLRADGIALAAEKVGNVGLGLPLTPCVRVLSIDGGGIRGIIPATILAEIELRTGSRIFELFDAIGGTSTGGILALGLTRPAANDPGRAKYAAADLVRMYEKKGATIFPPVPLKTIRGLAGPKYRADPLEDVLRDYFGDTLLVEALTNVVVPAYPLDRPGHVFFSTYLEGPPYVYMWEAARATSAAPTYFPPFRVPLTPEYADGLSGESIGLIDGGVFANNPAAYVLGLVKSTEHFQRGKPHDLTHPMLLLSLGTGRVPSTTTFEEAWGRGALRWIGPLIDILLSDPGVEDEARGLMSLSDHYFRLQPQIADASAARLDNVDPENIQRLKDTATAYLQEPQIARQLDELVSLLKRQRPPECERIVDPLGEREQTEASARLGMNAN